MTDDYQYIGRPMVGECRRSAIGEAVFCSKETWGVSLKVWKKYLADQFGKVSVGENDHTVYNLPLPRYYLDLGYDSICCTNVLL